MFGEPIDKQPLRIIETDHICDDIYDFAFWLELDPDKCLADLKRNYKKSHVVVQHYHVEPAFSDSSERRRRPIEIVSRSSHIVNEYRSVYEASVKSGFSMNSIYDCLKGKGNLAPSFDIRYI